MPAFLRPATFRWLFWLAALFSAVMAVIPQPPFVPRFEYGDKIEHILAFATLAALACLGFPEAPKRLVIERLSFFGAAIEVVQSIPGINRDCDVRDWLVDIAAVVLVCFVFAAVARRRRG